MLARFRNFTEVAISPDMAAGIHRVIAAALALLLLSPLAQAESLGRLFFTPERRAVLERQRQLNIEEKTQETIEVASVHINGVVRRSNGKATVWVNGRPQQDGEISSTVTVHSSSREPARVDIRVGDEPPTSMKIGEILNRATQEKADGLAGGQLQVNRNDADKLSHR